MTQRSQFAFRERAPAATRHFAKSQIADARADKALHFVAEFVKHPPDLAVQPLLEDNPQPGRAKLLQPDYPGAFAVEKNSLAQFIGEFWVPEFVEGDFVFFFHLVARVSEVLSEVTIAGEEKQTLGLGVETADVEEAGKLRRQ